MSPDVSSNSLTDYYRCPERYARMEVRRREPVGRGYFRFGAGATCYGNCYGQQPAQDPDGTLPDASQEVAVENETIYLPFDPKEIADNLRHEIYVGDWRSGTTSTLAKMYYFVRPVLPVSVRRHLQKFHLRNWGKLNFPQWPVDCSVDNLFEELMLLALKAAGQKRIPFIWFWPEGHSACAIMTHDVETAAGRDFCPTLIEIDESFGIKASIQVVPEERYSVTPAFLQSIRERGFEVVVHDLNHDGHLYKNREQFLERVAKINAYGKQFGADGFRAAVLYRKQVWYDALKCSFDMSVPNVAHLDPQRGGCCTVMPYFLGDIVEIPVTTVQDYTLFHILDDYSIGLWKQQCSIILEKHGLMSFIVHPDYVMTARQRSVYESLLSFLADMRNKNGVWITTPGEVNRWWRQRAELRLVNGAEGWQIEGAGKERARIAWASETDGRVVVELESSANGIGSGPANPGRGGDIPQSWYVHTDDGR
jgi:hypothetical protein